MTNIRTIEQEPRQRSYAVMAWNQYIRAMAAVTVGGVAATAVEVIEKFDYPTDDYPGLKTGIVIGAMARLGLGGINVAGSLIAQRALRREQTVTEEAHREPDVDEFDAIVAQFSDPSA